MDKSPDTSLSLCAGCPESFERQAMNDVGGRLFCAPCFQALLNPEAKLDAPAQVPEPPALVFESLISEPQSTDARCLLCSALMPDGPAKKIGGVGLCEACYQGLTLEPIEPATRKRESREEESVALEQVNESPRAEPRYTPGSGRTPCTGCGRIMPGPGSYQEISGGRYCPECVYGGKVPQEAASSPDIVAEEKQAKPPSGISKCDSCERALSKTTYEVIDGFAICTACMTTEPELALAIAKARHTRRLQDQAKTILES